MLSGVGKSGSPAPKSTTSTPEARSFSASAATRMVEDTLMVEIRSAMAFLATTCMGCNLNPSEYGFGKMTLEPHLDRRRHQPGDFSPQAEDFLHQARADKRIGLVGHHENRFDSGT